MKKSWLFVCLICSALLLSACGARSAGNGSGSGPGASGFGGNSSGSRTFTLTDEEKLALGTLKLDTSGQAIDRAEAGKLLPYWQLLHQLHSSTSAAPQEIAAVVDQIRSTLTPAQAAAVEGMQFSRADIFSAFQQQASASGSNTNGTGTTGPRNFSSGGNNRGNGGGPAFFFDGGGPGGGFGGGGGFRNNGGAANGTSTGATAQQGTNSAQRGQAFTSGITNALINQVISLLQDKLSG